MHIVNPATGNFNSFFIINKYGNSRFGSSDPFTERLTVDGDIYLYDPVASNMHSVRGRTSTGGINIQANSSNTDGAAISVYGTGHATNPGQVQLTATGTSGKGFAFVTNNTGSFSDKMQLDKDGLLHLSNNAQFDLMAPSLIRSIKGKTTAAALFLESNDGPNNGTSIELYGSNNTSTPGEMHFVVNGTSATQGYRFYNFNPSNNNYNELVNIHKDGKVIIGNPVLTSSPGAYKLYVADGIMTERVNVALKNTSAWSDYVFAPGYSLMPLGQVADYITEHKHLPGVPSAEEVVSKGLDMAAMDATLLKKIEELTLYTIELQKLVAQQSKEITELQKRTK